MSSIEAVVTMANGIKVYVDTVDSPAATHLKSNPELLGLVKDFLKHQSFHEEEVSLEYDTDHIVGNMDLVETDSKDEIVYAIRKNRDIYTRFVKNREPVPTSYITVILRKNNEGNYILWSAWIGRLVPTSPGNPDSTPVSKPFWDKHALVFGRQPIIEETLTDKYPW